MSDELDMQILQRDDQLLDALAARTAGTADGDVAVALLAALAADVDAQPIPLADAVALLAAAGAEPAGDGESATMLFPAPATVPHANGHHEAINGKANGTVRSLASAGSDHRRRRHAPRAAVAVGVVTAVVFAGSVAAAVTGDPLAPIRKVIQTVTGEPVKPEAVDRSLDGAGDALRRGDTRTAEDLIDEAQAKIGELDPDDAKRLQAALTLLIQQLAERAAATPGATTDPAATTEPGQQPSEEPPGETAEPSAEPSAKTGASEPAPEPSGEPSTSPDPNDDPPQEPSPQPTGQSGELSGDHSTRTAPFPPADPGGGNDNPGRGNGDDGKGSGQRPDNPGEQGDKGSDGGTRSEGDGSAGDDPRDERPRPVTEAVAETVDSFAAAAGALLTALEDALTPFA
jgi:hypothetical protein